MESLKARKAVWWFIREPAKLKEDESENLKQLLQASATANEVYGLVQKFMTMVRQLQGEQLEEWLSEVKKSEFEELHRFT